MEEPNSFLMNLPFNDTFKNISEYFSKIYKLPYYIWLIIILFIILVIVIFLSVIFFNKNNYIQKPLTKSNYFNPEMTYYVCSYGGCGSYMLCAYLKQFGKVEHIHSRKPPINLEYIGNKNTTKPVYSEWFNGVKIPEKDLNKYKVIYLYKNPVKAIYSRFEMPDHLVHVQCDRNIKLRDVINLEKDLYGIEDFYDNYTAKEERNYKIHCVKYEGFWDNIQEFNQTLGIPNNPKLYPIRKETKREENHNHILYRIYDNLINKMNNMNFIEIV